MLGAIEHFTGASIPWPIYALAMGLAFIVACFRAFQDQYTEASGLRVDLSNALRLQQNEQDWKKSHDAIKQMYDDSAKELSDLRAYIGPPHPFSLEQRQTLVACLQAIPAHQRSEIHIQFPAMGGGGSAANRMAEAFRQAGWNATTNANLILRGELTGICVGCAERAWQGHVPLPERAKTIMHVLETTGIDYQRTRRGGDEQDDYFDFIVCASPTSVA